MKKNGRNEEQPIYKNLEASFEERARDLVSRMTLKEKASQMVNNAKAIPRLGIPGYNWWSECLHGVARAGYATVFPQAIGMAATFNRDLLFEVATIISDEARAIHHERQRNRKLRFKFETFILFGRGLYQGLTFWSPNINIFRDPRFGRGQETYGEDPYLTSQMGIAFVTGLQGNDEKYLKVVATPKHYACYSGPEKGRFSFDAKVSVKDLRETYLIAFKECVKRGKAMSIMGAYNKVNGVPCCSNKLLLTTLLREEWGFDGYVVSDCFAIFYIWFTHKYVKSRAQAAACAVKNGCDLACGGTYKQLPKAVKKGLISEDQIDQAVIRLFKARFQLGMFDPPELVPYANIPYEINDCAKHRKMALRTARESIVLLKNKDNILPLDKNLKIIAVIGPNANNKEVLLGNYHGTPSKSYTPLEGIRNKVASDTTVLYAKGCNIKRNSCRGVAKAIETAKKAEVVIMCLGIDQSMECEDLPWIWHPDRQYLEFAKPQQKLLETIYALGKPIILVLLNGSSMAIPWADEHIPAILEAWYPGEEGGNAIADVIFGDYSPAGRLPVTFYKSTADLPPIRDYNMKGRTYRYIEIEPLYPFGYGLSYTKFDYNNLLLSADEIRAGENLEVSIEVENVGAQTGDEVIQLYLKDLEASVKIPHHQLQGFRRITLAPSERMTVSFTITPRQMALITDDGRCVLEPGKFSVFVGGSQCDSRSKLLTGNDLLEAIFEVIGEEIELEY